MKSQSQRLGTSSWPSYKPPDSTQTTQNYENQYQNLKHKGQTATGGIQRKHSFIFLAAATAILAKMFNEQCSGLFIPVTWTPSWC